MTVVLWMKRRHVAGLLPFCGHGALRLHDGGEEGRGDDDRSVGGWAYPPCGLPRFMAVECLETRTISTARGFRVPPLPRLPLAKIRFGEW